MKIINGKTVIPSRIHKKISEMLWQYNPTEVWKLVEDNLINFEYPLDFELHFLENRLKSTEPKH